MAALTILIIRHGEKPGDVTPPAGVTPDGVQDGRSLLVRGWQRAGAWAALFGAGLGGASYPAPGIIYACRPDPSPASDDDPPSQRPFETITPLADALRLVPRLTFGQDEGEDLASEVAALSGVVLIAWEHKRITGVIVPALLRGQAPAGVPLKWDRTRFDVVLRFDRPASDAPWSFRQMFPRLLAGDSDASMP